MAHLWQSLSHSSGAHGGMAWLCSPAAEPDSAVAWPLRPDPLEAQPYGRSTVEVWPHPLHPLSDPGRRRRCCYADPDDGLSSPLPAAHPGTPPPRSATDPGAPPPRTHAGLDPSLAVVVLAQTRQQRAPPSSGDADATTVSLGGPLGSPSFFN
ncbi:hypothetical protein BDA96_01G003000 [Sorghum bicolor]|uniref:Uncharacterized protein n=2 Tax=Sorghum bicolor TaxID=4558 RepID=A0A921RTY4_SORBI|nr:hypothetical protein BDA96_01G003000 [Sorghum bicolor]KXG37073.1 hypothetical protein SORBI_3001G002900 [Sorghum bicolor]